MGRQASNLPRWRNPSDNTAKIVKGQAGAIGAGVCLASEFVIGGSIQIMPENSGTSTKCTLDNGCEYHLFAPKERVTSVTMITNVNQLNPAMTVSSAPTASNSALQSVANAYISTSLEYFKQETKSLSESYEELGDLLERYVGDGTVARDMALRYKRINTFVKKSRSRIVIN